MLVDIKKERKREVKVGDFMLCDGTLRVFIKIGFKFYAVQVEGGGAFNGAMMSRNSISEILDWYDEYEYTYEIIPAEELKIVRV